ncbi:Mycobacterium terramassiliense ORFan, partial [Mycobacterium terramassiliense]
VNEQRRREQAEAKQRAAEALRNVNRSTALPRGLRWMTGQAVQLQCSERRITGRQLYHGKYADRS